MQEITGCSSVEIHALTGLLLSGPGTGVPLPWAILRPADASEVRRRHPASTGPFGSFGLLPPAVFCQRSGPGPRPKPEERCLGGGGPGGGALGDAVLAAEDAALPGPDLLRRLRKLRTPEAKPGEENGPGPARQTRKQAF